jgi:hypothetical protein
MPARSSTASLLLSLLAVGACAGDLSGQIGDGIDEPANDDATDVVDDSLPGEDGQNIDISAPIEGGLRARIVNTGGLRLRLRSGPSYGYSTIELMNAGDVVEVDGAPVGSYLPVTHLGTSGWAHGYYLEALPPEDDTPDPSPQDPPSSAGGTAFLLPWQGGVSYRVSQGHGVGSHTGKGVYAWDFAMPSGTPVRAAHDGVVRRARGDSTIGGCSSSYANSANYVVLDRGDGLESLYLHLSSTTVQPGDIITRGQLLGFSGATGWACGAHLHYQVQLSPDGGGTTSWYNQSQHEFFHDSGEAYDPPAGSYPVSANAQ